MKLPGEIKTFFGPIADTAAQVNAYLGSEEFSPTWVADAAEHVHGPETAHMLITVALLPGGRYASSLHIYEEALAQDADAVYATRADAEAKVRELLRAG